MDHQSDSNQGGVSEQSNGAAQGPALVLRVLYWFAVALSVAIVGFVVYVQMVDDNYRFLLRGLSNLPAGFFMSLKNGSFLYVLAAIIPVAAIAWLYACTLRLFAQTSLEYRLIKYVVGSVLLAIASVALGLTQAVGVVGP